MDRWAGKVAVVTGASSGIGAAIAKDLAERGVIVVALARRLERLQELAASTKQKIHPKQCDVRNELDILSTFRWVETTLGGVDILVNNAGVLNLATLMSGETEKWQQIFDTNVRGLNICTREALKSMRQRGDNGHIFHINSDAGHVVPNYPGLTVGVYSASKHAVTALTEALRIELQQAKSHIKITSISPGAVDTEMASVFMADVKQKDSSIEKILVNDILSPQDISEAVMYSLSTRPNVQIHEIMIRPLQ